jgi:hypothetical protein
MHIDQSLFDEHRDPSAHVLYVMDHGAVLVDLDTDQPPYIGLFLELVHHDMPDTPFTQMYRLSRSQLVSLAATLYAYVEVFDEM